MLHALKATNPHRIRKVSRSRSHLSSQPAPLLRFAAFLTTLLFVWMSLLALPISAAAQALAKPTVVTPKPIPTPKLIPTPPAHDDPTWHTIDYRKPRYTVPVAKSGQPLHLIEAPNFSLLNEVGRLAHPIPADMVAEWKAQLHLPKSQSLPAGEIAKRHVWLGEYTLAHDEQPEQALWHFNQAQRYSKRQDIAYGLAAEDKAITAFFQGAYLQAAAEFEHVLRARPALRGFDRRTCTSLLRHARACAGYHAERLALGIPEPTKLDPLCGVSAIAVALKAAGKPYDKARLLANVRVTGRGSNMQDLVTGAEKLGFNVHVVHVTEQGLIALPKPLICFAEHDHFISVLHADKQGVDYLCSDCGAWPGGRIHLKWSQWRRLEATLFATLTQPGSVADDALALLAPDNGTKLAGIQVASLSPLLSGDVMAPIRLAGRLKKQIMGWSQMGLEQYFCGFTPGTAGCDCVVECATDCFPGGCNTGPHDPVNLASGEEEYAEAPDLSIYNPIGPSVGWTRLYDSLRGYDTTYDFQDYGIGWSHSYNYSIYDPNAVRRPGTYAAGDTITIPATGADAPVSPDLWEITLSGAVIASDHTPNGWSASNLGNQITVTIPRTAAMAAYEVKSTSGAQQIGPMCLVAPEPSFPVAHQRAGRRPLALCLQGGPPISGGGSGLTSAYFTVGPRYMTTTTGTRYVVEPNGARVAVTAPSVPTAANPHVVCSVATGHPFRVLWNYSPTDVNGIYTVQHANRGTMQFGTNIGIIINQNGATNAGYALSYALTQIADRNNNLIYLNYNGSSYNGFPLLVSLSDTSHQTLLTLNRDANSGLITSAADRYGRSVYYSCGTYAIQNPWPGKPNTTPELDHVSQVVLTNTPHPPDHYVFGYQNIFNGDVSPTGNETFPFLHTITVPSPTGVGLSTATMNYTPSLCTISSIVDANGNIHSYRQPDMNHTQVSVLDPQGHVAIRFTVGFDMNMSATSTTDGTVDANGKNTTVVSYSIFSDPNDPYRPSLGLDGIAYANSNAFGAGAWDYSWDQFGNCLTTTSPRGVITTNTYDYSRFALGELMQTQTGGQQATNVTYYEPSGNIHTVTSPLPGTVNGTQSVTSSCTYSALGNMLTVTSPGNNTVAAMTTTLNYGAVESLGLPQTVTDNLGKSTGFLYDGQGRTLHVSDALGNTSNASYNILGQPLVGSANGPGTTVNTYLYPGGPLTQTALYDGNNTLVRHVNPVYGNQGETLTATGDINPATVAYDAWYRAIALSDGNHQTTWTTYGPAGYVSQSQLANGDTYRATSWDLDGNVLSSTDARGVVTNFSYADPERQLTDVQHPIVPALDVHFSYDGYGRTAAIADGTGTRSAAYDDNNATTSVTTTYRNAAGNGNLPPLTLGYAFYPDGSLSSMTTPAGSFSYGFDGRGLPSTMSNSQGQNFGWSYFDNGWLATQSLSNVATAAYSYDGLGQLTHLSHHKQDMAQTLLADFSGMTHDVVGNRLTLTSSVPNAPAAYSGSTGYQYDNRNQLTQEVSGRAGGYSNNYAFDLVGNPTSWKGAPQTFNSANQNNLNNTLTFDGNGNPAGFSGTALNWDVNDNLFAFGNVLTAGYNADGLRAWKQTAAGRTYFLYNGLMPVCEVDGNGNVTAVNTWGATGLLARFVTGTGGGSVFYCFDPQGSASVRLDAGGNILSSHTNEAWGTQISTVATNDPYAGYGGQWGYYKDVETGLHLLGQRYYDTSSGRFLNRDPIGYEGGINVYAYCGNNPTRFIDPFGLDDTSVWDQLGKGSTWGSGLTTSGFALAHVCTLGFYDGGSHKNDPGFGVSSAFWGIGIIAGGAAVAATAAGSATLAGNGSKLALGLGERGLGEWATANGYLAYDIEPLVLQTQGWQNITGWMWNAQTIAFRLRGMSVSGFVVRYVCNPLARTPESISTNKELWYILSHPGLWSRTDFIH